MKNTWPNSNLSSSLIACVLTIGSLALTQSASAQGSTAVAKVDIPFAFQMANQTFPAGTYQIDREPNHVIQFRGPDRAGRFVVMNEATKIHPADRGVVVFKRYGSKYFLREIWTEGATSGLECTKSRAESNLVKAQNSQAATSVELAFNTAPMK